MQCRNENAHKHTHNGAYNGNERKKEMEMSYLGVDKKDDLWATQWPLLVGRAPHNNGVLVAKTNMPTTTAPMNRTNEGRQEQRNIRQTLEQARSQVPSTPPAEQTTE